MYIYVCAYESLATIAICGCARYLNDRGTLAEERWKALKWRKPEDETTQCWWLVLTVKLAHVLASALPLPPPHPSHVH